MNNSNELRWSPVSTMNDSRPQVASNGVNGRNYGAYTNDNDNDENDSYYEQQKPLIPQHTAAEDGTSLRSRRRTTHAGSNNGVPQNHANTNLNAGFDDADDKDEDGGTKYNKLGNTTTDPQRTRSLMTNATYSTNGTFISTFKDNRPTLNNTKIKSISRIGRSTSLDESYYEEDKDTANNDPSGEYYFDDNNDYSHECTFGTSEHNGIWLCLNDPPGTTMSIIVWILIIYSGITISLLGQHHNLSPILAYFYCTICAMALACHARTMFTDPGAVPSTAVPVNSAARRNEVHLMCQACRSYKPPGSHHCRICNRCVSRMDHHCPWMNNCIGAANLKPFILFLSYTWIGCAFSLIVFGCNYFFCNNEKCEFSGVLVQLVRIMTIICTGAIMFVSSMLANVSFGILTGSGTIDRLKRKLAPAPVSEVDDPPLALEDIFGIGGYVTWFLPVDPIFPDYDRVLGYSMPQRMLREGNENTSIC